MHPPRSHALVGLRDEPRAGVAAAAERVGLLDERGAAAYDGVFSTASNAIDRNMGAIPRAVLARPERQRGDHPLASFSAIGPLATDLIGGQHGAAVHAPAPGARASRTARSSWSAWGSRA